jgi:hypothetical protein
MSVSYIPDWIKQCLWGTAAGRCQYAGCNRALYRDDWTKAEFNSAYIAHIIADKPDGPRGDPILSPQLKADLGNLMLLCDPHHRLIDKIDVEGHPVELLRGMKKQHENRIALLTSLRDERASHVLLYGARVGEHDAPLSFKQAVAAIIPQFRPAAERALELSLKNSSYSDAETVYWTLEREHLGRQFSAVVKPLLRAGEIDHLSVFGFAPIPLLMELGRLLSDIPDAEVYQLHREPPGLIWKDDPQSFAYTVERSGPKHGNTVALVLALSAVIQAERVQRVLGAGVPLWTMSHPSPGNDFLQSRLHLRKFREHFRAVLNDIKSVHGEDAALHVFPAIPVSAAIEAGRVWMPKADLPLTVYDQNRATGGFSRAIVISQGEVVP